MSTTNDSRGTVELQVPVITSEISVLDAALLYADAGFYCVPLKPGTKNPGSIVGKAWETKSSRDVVVIRRWFDGPLKSKRGLAIHVGRSGCLAFDVDNPDKLHGSVSDAIDALNPPYQATRDNSNGRGHYIFRQPPGRQIGNQLGRLANGWGELRGKNGVIVVAPTVHSKSAQGGFYRWMQAGTIPVLPDTLSSLLADHEDSKGAVSTAEAELFFKQHTDHTDSGRIKPIKADFIARVAEGNSRRQNIVHALCWAMREASQGYFSAEFAANELLGLFAEVMNKPTATSQTVLSPDEAQNEFMPRLCWAIGEVTKPMNVVPLHTSNGRDRTSGGGKRRLKLIRGSETVSKKVVWVWTDEGEGRLPAGTLSVVSGDGNIGKSPFTLWLAAQVSNGTLPGDWKGTPADVLIYGSEDSWESTIHPRLKAANADMDRVHNLAGTELPEDKHSEMPLDWNEDLADIEAAIVELGAKMVIIDPLMDVINSASDSHKDKDVRTNLMPLVAMAERTGAVVMGITHFNKSRSGDANTATMGSVTFRNLPRSVFQLAKDQETETFIFTQNKNNLGKSDLPSLTYEMESVNVEIEGEQVSQPVFKFTGYSERTVEDALRSKAHGGGGSDATDVSAKKQSREDAKNWLVGYLKAQEYFEIYGGYGASVGDIKRDAMANGIPYAKLYRARAELGCIESQPHPTDKAKNRQIWVLQAVTLTMGDR